MRILQIAPAWEPVPPPAYGGTESVVSLLTEELVRRGHDVTLWASGDSQTAARLESVCPRALRTAECADTRPWDLLHAASALARAGEFDIVHNHAGEVVLAMADLVRRPILSTLHCAITDDTWPLWNRHRGWYNAISHAQARGLPPLAGPKLAGVVHNAVDVKTFPFREEKEDFLLFLARICPEKGVTIAIEVARRLDRQLIIAGKVDRADAAYFQREVEPLIDGDQVVFVGEADGERKRDLLSRAACLLLPLQWEEPFGLALAEALACGTAVVACPRGAAPEVVEHGVGGFLAEGIDDLCQAVADTGRIRPADCRARAEQRFDVATMVAGYEELYGKILRHDELAGDIRTGIIPVASVRQNGRVGSG
jgi:glycosyltransferase involved in cell wall biosynthesis